MKVLKIIQIIKTHPKKVLFFSSLIGFGVCFGKNKLNEQHLMQVYCKEAQKYGELPQILSEHERHITVILNPAANSGKSNAKYESYCAPILHLAGLKVALVKTGHSNEAKEIMEIMDNTDAVVVAGGDGTLSEVLTGLLRRNDSDAAVDRFPIAILPLGEKNTTSYSILGKLDNVKSLLGFSTENVERLARSTISVVRNFRSKLDVVEVAPLQVSAAEINDVEIETNEKSRKRSSDSKPIYATSLMQWGAFRDASERKTLYWYWGFLKKYLVYVFSTYRDLTWNCDCEIEYTDPCDGCSRCRSNKKNQTVANQAKNQRWWHSFVPKSNMNQRKKEGIDYSQIKNEKCGQIHSLNLDGVSELTIKPNSINKTNNTVDDDNSNNNSQNNNIGENNSRENKHIERNTRENKDIGVNNISQDCEIRNENAAKHYLELNLGKKDISSLEFIKEGWRRERGGIPNSMSKVKAAQITVMPKLHCFQNSKGEDREVNINNETFELKPFKVRILPNAVNIFHHSSR